MLHVMIRMEKRGSDLISNVPYSVCGEVPDPSCVGDVAISRIQTRKRRRAFEHGFGEGAVPKVLDK